MYYCTMLLLLAVLLASVLVDRCHSAILWQPKSNPCAENSVGPSSNTENISTEYDGHHSPILNGRQRNIVNLPQMYLKPSATILYKRTIFNTRKRNNYNAPDTDTYNLHRNTYSASSKLSSTFAKWLVNKQQVQRKLTEAKPRHQHDKGYIKCEYRKAMPVRHARAIDMRDERMRPVNKRRSAVSDLTLCHFKICNMGRKRTTRYFHMIDELTHDN